MIEMDAKGWRIRLAVALALSACVAIGACAPRQIRTAPPGFEPGAPILTGDEALDARVARARSVTSLTDADIASLRKSVVAGVVGQDVVFVLAMAYLAKGDSAAAVDVLRRWVEEDDYDELAMAAFIDVAIGAEQYETCISGVEDLLVQWSESPWLHIALGVCLERIDQGPLARYAYEQGVGRVGTFGGLTGSMELELGLVPPPQGLTISESNLAAERARLLDFLAQTHLVGHVALRHRTGVSLDDSPLEPRLAELGGVTHAELDRIFLSRREVFRHCQLLAKKRRKLPGGRMVIELTIEGDGSPGKIEYKRNTFEVDAVPACVEEQIRNMWFPQPRYGKSITYERDFRMQGD